MPPKKMSEEELKAEYEREMALIDQYNNEMDFVEASTQRPEEMPKPETGFMGAVETAANVMDIPQAFVRTGVEAAISPEREIIPEVTKLGKRLIEEPTTASTFAPRGADINKAIASRMGMEYKPESIPGKIAGFTTELATESLFNPIGLGLSATKKVREVIRKPLLNASERQAATVISRYATRPKTLAEGADPEIIAKRLVAEDLQGEMRNPSNFYKKIAGKSHIVKERPDTLDTLVIKRGEKESGLIGDISESISSMLKTLDKTDKTKIQISNVGNKILFDKMFERLSKTSGVTPNETAIRDILDKTLKPYTTVKKMEIPVGTELSKAPGSLELMQKDVKELVQIDVPQQLSLSEAHELRKNIGRLLSDRDFYKTPDQAMALETETLREVYSELGTAIKKSLENKNIKIGTKNVDALQFYEAQNNRLKSMYDLKSMLEYTPYEQLKQSDMAALMTSMGIKGGILGGAALTGAMLELPQYATQAGILGATMGAGAGAFKTIDQATPEYLTSIFKQAAKIAPTVVPPVATQGSIMYLRGGQQVPQSEFGRFPQSVGIDPMQIAKARLPRTTEGLIQNKELLVAKLSQAGVDPEIIKTAVQALNEDPESVSNLAPMLTMQAPHVFEKSKYNMFDGVILDPEDRARAADGVSKRDDLSSIQKAKIINELNKTGKWLGE